MSYFTTPDRRTVYYKDIDTTISKLHPELKGEHIFPQLDALGLRKEFDAGHTPYSLPYTFTGCSNETQRPSSTTHDGETG